MRGKSEVQTEYMWHKKKKKKKIAISLLPLMCHIKSITFLFKNVKNELDLL